MYEARRRTIDVAAFVASFARKRCWRIAREVAVVVVVVVEVVVHVTMVAEAIV